MQEQLDNNINSFIMAKDRARKLIQMDTNGTLGKIKQKAISEGKMSYSENGEVVAQNIEEYRTQNNNNVIPSNIKSKSKLPTEIIESFKKQPSPTDYQGSVLDMVQQASGGKMFSEEKHITVEQPTNTQPIVQSNIDYSMIKMIVEDCMRKYTSALKKSILSESKINENVGTLQAMKIGDKFSFITSNGDLYEAKLTFIKNMNTKKGGK